MGYTRILKSRKEAKRPKEQKNYCGCGNMHPKLKWNRTQTIGRGRELCDFDITAID